MRSMTALSRPAKTDSVGRGQSALERRSVVGTSVSGASSSSKSNTNAVRRGRNMSATDVRGGLNSRPHRFLAMRPWHVGAVSASASASAPASAERARAAAAVLPPPSPSAGPPSESFDRSSLPRSCGKGRRRGRGRGGQ
eukprot:124594-Chlamydomonas_euryale.AAC.9